MSLGAFALGISEFAAMGLLPQVAAATGASLPDTGMTISAYALGVVVGAPVIALLFAQAPRRGFLVSLALLIAAGNLLTALAPNFLGTVAARFLAGLPHGAFLGTAAMVAASLVAPDRRASAVGRVLIGLSLANVVGVPLATWLGQVMNWRLVFALVAVIAIATALLVRLCLPAIGPGPKIGIRGEIRAITRLQPMLALSTAAIGFGGMFAIYSYIAPTLTEVTHASPGMVPVMLAIFGLGMIAGNMAGGWLADRGQMRAVWLMLIAAAIVQAAFLLTAHNIAAVAINIFLVGATSMGLAPGLQTRVMDVTPDAQMLAASINHSAFNIANALGAWLGGAVIAAGFGFTATGAVGAALVLGGLTVHGAATLLDQRREAEARA
ncbi:MFS transporter [Acetobacteraceae bacterium H6797]|nr:MFS transporter [Acetobacteraceae bacterium H6797]